MKKIILFILILLCLFSFTSCKRPDTYVYLGEDEYFLYENGNLIQGSDKFASGRYDFTNIEQTYKKYNLETKRGIKVGSSILNFYNAYKDYACFVYFYEYGTLRSSPPRSYVVHPPKEGETTKIKFVSQIIGSDILDSNDFVEFDEYTFEEKGYYSADPDPNDDNKHYWIIFTIDSTEVVNISIEKE